MNSHLWLLLLQLLTIASSTKAFAADGTTLFRASAAFSKSSLSEARAPIPGEGNGSISSNTSSNNSDDDPNTPEYYKSVYEVHGSEKSSTTATVGTLLPDSTGAADTATSSTRTSKTPWDIGGPQPSIVQAYNEGKLRGRILDAGCGFGENSIFLAAKYGVASVVGFDLAEGAIRTATDRAQEMERSSLLSSSSSLPFWTTPRFVVASCTEIASSSSAIITSSSSRTTASENEDAASQNCNNRFDVAIDSGLLHCLTNTDARTYVSQLAELVTPKTGRAYVGCFSTANPDPWSNPRRLSGEYLASLFCEERGWEIAEIKDTWWSRPRHRGSKQGSFSQALWMEARRL